MLMYIHVHNYNICKYTSKSIHVHSILRLSLFVHGCSEDLYIILSSRSVVT